MVAISAASWLLVASYVIYGCIDGLPSAKVRATKNIRNNKEIFVNYGKDYKMSEQGVTYSTRYKK